MAPAVDVAIVGAGIGGLSAALFLHHHHFKVTVYEASPTLPAAGAGIQIPPNSARIYKAYNLCGMLETAATQPKAVYLRRYSDGDVLRETPLVPQAAMAFGAPYLISHRADYQHALYQTALEAGITIHMGQAVTEIDTEKPSLKMQKATHEFDLVIGADGVGSRVRAALLGQSNFTPLLSPHRVYHALVPRALMLTKPASASLIESKCINAWLGPDRHIVGYPIRGGQLYNLVMVHVGPAAFDRWDQDGNVGEMNKVYEDFDPVIRETLSFVERAKSWKLVESATLESWSSKSGRVVLLGDAAHAMLPYLAQEAAQSIEDASVLAICLQASDWNSIPKAIRAYESIRKPRVERVVVGSRASGDTWHLPDGEEQRKRDASFRSQAAVAKAALRGQKDIDRLNQTEREAQIANADFQRWLFGYDAVADAEEKLSIINNASISGKNSQSPFEAI